MLTVKDIDNSKPKEKPYKLFDGGGLYLEVSPAGGKLWRFKYRFMGKEKRLALGAYPEVKLADVRRRTILCLGLRALPGPCSHNQNLPGWLPGMATG